MCLTINTAVMTLGGNSQNFVGKFIRFFATFFIFFKKFCEFPPLVLIILLLATPNRHRLTIVIYAINMSSGIKCSRDTYFIRLEARKWGTHRPACEGNVD